MHKYLHSIIHKNNIIIIITSLSTDFFKISNHWLIIFLQCAAVITIIDINFNLLINHSLIKIN